MRAGSAALPSPTPSRRARAVPRTAEQWLAWVCIAVPTLALILFFLFPLATIFLHSVTLFDGSIGLDNYRAITTTPGLVQAGWNSLAISAGTTLVCIVLGFAIAYGLERTCMRGREAIRIGLLLPLLAPSLVQGLGLLFLLGRNGLVSRWLGIDMNIYGFWGLLLSDVFYALPQAIMIIQAALRSADTRYYDAATVMGASASQRFFHITLPNCRFGLLSAAFVVFTITITDFGNAAVIAGDYRVLATEIFNQVSGQQNFGMGSVVGIILLAPALVSVYIERVSSQKQFGVATDGQIPVQPQRKPLRDSVFTAIAWLTVLLILSIVAVVVFASFVKLWPYNMALTLANFDVNISSGYTPIWTTLYVSVVAAVAGVLLLFAMAYGMRQIHGPVAKAIYLLAVLPVGVPGLVLGLSYIFAFNNPATPLYWFYGTAVLIALCNFYHYHTQGFLTMTTGMRAVPQALEEAVSCLGGRSRHVLGDVILPFIAPTVLAVFFFLFMRSMVTLSAVIFLVTPELNLAAVSVMHLNEAGFVSQAAAFSTIIIIVVACAMLLMRGLVHHFRPNLNQKLT
ncbi:ABC transporter permease subunit [Allopusillimonas soli]|uniref:ABC transporter permease subunit n=1 Tax=Allopusillimonas soli TaxID=659016 RepID=A0A853F769_9BURK|nr:ABC transporter permease subunit [Allopusillimonas soli]NYT35943.1 ABC transporter permease subunit [Allopusillimonas soli]TEA76294.1 ABC transporter permease subunit [Allopusillimonas soli]